jgi:hypothetical protein
LDSQIDVRLLGHFEVDVSGERVRFEGVKQRRLFAMLALRAPEAVSADELVEALRGDEPPTGAGPALGHRVRAARGAGASTILHRYLNRAVDVILQCPSKAASRSTGFVEEQHRRGPRLVAVQGGQVSGGDARFPSPRQSRRRSVLPSALVVANPLALRRLKAILLAALLFLLGRLAGDSQRGHAAENADDARHDRRPDHFAHGAIAVYWRNGSRRSRR